MQERSGRNQQYLQETLRDLSRDYINLNGSTYETRDGAPSALEFSRVVHISRPVVFQDCRLIPDPERWTNDYLIERMGEVEFSVAVTPDGHADAITPGPEGRLYFVEPHVQNMTMSKFISLLLESDEVHYLQSQNGNLYPGVSEFKSLRDDIPDNVSWCTEALGRQPEAVNLWIGDDRSVTSFHSDPFENVYTVIRGSKHFTLLPPTHAWSLRERKYPHATYSRLTPNSPLSVTPSQASEPLVRWSSILDPAVPGALDSEIVPLYITLHAGDTLYLPAGWWHHVRQSGGITIAVNWWYDMEMRGMAWVWLSFLRSITDIPSTSEDVDISDS